MLDWLAHRAQISPHKTALIYQDQAWTYAALNQRVAAVCARLAEMGIWPANKVAVLMPNGPQYVMLIHALARIGAVMVPLNARLTGEELNWQIAHCDASWLIRLPEEDELASQTWPGYKQRNLWLWRDEELPSEAPDWLSRPLNLDSVQGIIYTSGTTGQPKGAMLTYANHLWSANASAYRLDTLPEDRWLLCMPLYHVGGQAVVFRCCLYGTTIVLHDSFKVAAASNTLDHQDITLVSLVPTMLHRLLDHRGDRPFPASLRHILLGGAAASAALIDRSIVLNQPVSLTYGLTEAASQVATSTPDQVRQKPGSVGRPLMFSSVRIIDQDGRELPPGEIGEIVISGPTVMQGYYHNPEATARTLRDGALYTGDLGYLDEDGDLWIAQRRTDLIVSGGENVYPSEVEAILESHPGIAEACVVGLPDPEWGQRVAAMMVCRDASLSEASIIAYCQEHLAGYKLPRLIDFTNALPRTPSGKVQRDRVARLIEERTFTGTIRRGR